ncbi:MULTISPECIES: hypothetical protein [Nocardia]|uniref:hypothetical protein n=1 Tax=Nocardia TaxID=1817 RepID=UPI00135688C6|nr:MULTISPECIES: hypothetical protein [Nocardia]
MEGNKPIRKQLEWIPPGFERGQIRSISGMAPVVVEELIDNPDGPEPLTVLRRLPGVHAYVTLYGWPFEFEVRVVEVPGGKPQVVDLRLHSPAGGDVAITNSDLKSVPLARIAAAIGLEGNLFDTRRFGEPEKHIAAAPEPRSGRGRPRKLTDDFLRRVVEFAHEAHRNGQPINAYVAASVEPEPTKQPRPETVRWWLSQARERELLKPGELARNPKAQRTQKDTQQ